MPPILVEPFTDTATTNLTAHTTVVTWAKQTSATGDIVISNTNTARGNSDGATASYYVSKATRSRNYDVISDYVNKTTVANHYIWLEGQANTGDFVAYAAVRDNAAGTWKISEFDAGGGSADLGTYAQALTNGVTYNLRLELRVASQKLYVDGVERVATTDATITAVGRAGLGIYSEGAPTDTTSVHWDNFMVVEHGSCVSLTGAGR